MLKMISLKLDQKAFLAADRIAKKTHVSRNAYINRAVKLMNRLHERKLLSERYRMDAREANASSAEVLKEFEAFQDEGL